QPFQRALGSIAKTPTKTIPSRGSQRQDRLSDDRTAEGPTTTARARGGLGLIATVRQQVLRVRRDPEVGQERTRATVTPCHARFGPTTPTRATGLARLGGTPGPLFGLRRQRPIIRTYVRS